MERSACSALNPRERRNPVRYAVDGYGVLSCVIGGTIDRTRTSLMSGSISRSANLQGRASPSSTASAGKYTPSNRLGGVRRGSARRAQPLKTEDFTPLTPAKRRHERTMFVDGSKLR